MKIQPVGPSSSVWTDRKTDRHTWWSCHFLQFCVPA